ncbi:TIGR04283 family arsenosugar biosynthesis glycosyltransferase [Candidatus Laterigemmans baculatus]|uniref:TIGR04283 family arsenosugar biosynthesis glycosyltransferase n=1 Tax=Candidatus Laterigemmans baculatus TaxID=2770505 RepID=UPI0013DCAB52|nr:TIGR04283 family arsenosugar biosynthesis glycosyltransferase [Candidatus Laterigemmans baculatus]
MNRVSVSVIIPAIQEARGIERAVRSAIAGGAVETIVVDGGSRDETPERATAAGALVLRSPAGRARQQNVGAAAAKGDVLLFLHADNHLAPTAIDQIAAHFAAAPERRWGALRQRIEDDAASYRLLEWGNAARVRWRGLPFGDQAIFVCREWFGELGGFPDEPLMEDLILASRLRRLSRPVLLDGPVFVDARRWRARGVWRQTWLNLRLQWRFARGASPTELATAYRRHDA